MQRSFIEILLGAIVLLAVGIFSIYAFNSQQNITDNTYRLKARFTSVAGLNEGSDVRMGGVKIGKIQKQYIDPETYATVVIFSIQDQIKLPEDSSASIASTGLLGGKFMRITAGNSATMLANNNELQQTQDPVSLEDLLSRAIFLIANESTQ